MQVEDLKRRICSGSVGELDMYSIDAACHSLLRKITDFIVKLSEIIE
jgi:hypothetical protein